MASRSHKSSSSPGRAGVLLARHGLLAVLLLADIATKVAAFRFLPEGKAVSLLPGLRLYLAVNEWGVMGGVHGIGRVTANPAYTTLLGFGLVAFAYFVLRLGSSSLAFAWRVVAGTLFFFAIAFAAQAIAIPLARISPPADVIVAIIRVAVLLVSLAFYAASKAPLPRFAFTLLAAGALANAASYTYPPFEVVDFVVVPLRPFLGLLGKGTASALDADIGVINLADVYLFAFPLLLLAWPPSALLRRTRAVATA